MKTFITIGLFMLTMVAWTQEKSRLFYQTEEIEATKSFNFVIADYNGTPYFFSTKELVAGNVLLTYGPLDEQTLSPLSYNYIPLTISGNLNIFLNGINIIGDDAEIIIQESISSTQSKLNFVKVNLSNHSLFSLEGSTDLFFPNFYRARVVNQKLVLYGIKFPSKEFVRLEKSMNEPYLLESISVVSGAINSISKGSDFELVNNEEFACVVPSIYRVGFIKRDQNGIFSDTLVTDTPINRYWEFATYANSKFIYIAPNYYTVVDQELSLNSINTSLLPTVSGPNPSFVANYNEGVLTVAAGGYSEINFKQYNSTLDSVNFYSINHRGELNDFVKRGNEFWLTGVSIKTEHSFGGYLRKNALFINRINANHTSLEFDRDLKLNNFNLNLGSLNRLFPFRETNTNGYALDGPLTNERSIIFNSSNNILAKNTNNEVVGIWSSFDDDITLFQGPIFTSNLDFNLQRDKYNRSFYVTSEMIASHVGHILTYNNPNYGIPHGILHWPTHGNTQNGEAQNLANFVDHNNNGIYEPLLGEFPKIYGDNCLLTIYHSQSGSSLSHELEVHRYFFNFNCDTNEVLKNVFFCNNRYINRGGDLKDLYVGSYIDYDLGYAGDDYVGTNVGLGMVYAYNGDAFDETNGVFFGFQDSLAAHGYLVLSGAKLMPDGEDNPEGVQVGESINGLGFGDGIVDNEYYTLESSFMYTNGGIYPYTDPTVWHEGYYSMQGFLQDGSHNDIYPGRYMNLGQSDPLFYATRGVEHTNNYSESAQGNSPGDRRLMSGSGPGFLGSGDTLNYLTAYVLARGAGADPVNASLNELFDYGQRIRTYFMNNDVGCGKNFGISDASLHVKTAKTLDFAVYPNPFLDEVNIQHDFNGTVGLSIKNINGQEVYHAASISKNEAIYLELNAGIYFVELATSKGNVVKKLIRK